MASICFNRFLRPDRRLLPFRRLRHNAQTLNFSTSAHSYAPLKSIREVSQPWERFLPIIIRPSFWKMMVPIPLRKDARLARKEANRGKPWNPATFFIIMGALIGSWSIHFINLRHRYAIAGRHLDNKIARLREVLRRLQAGEDVDVEKMLGTGDPLAEQEWEEVMKKIEEEDRLWKSKERRDARKKARKEAKEAAAAALAAENSPASSNQFANTFEDIARDAEPEPKRTRAPSFY